jgi:DUF917 family protein
VGRAVIDGFGGASAWEIDFKNENLLARVDGAVRALVPDIITVLDRETAEAIVTERLKFGQRVRVVGASAPAAMRTPEALAVVGPQVFGIAEPYRAIETLNGWEPRWPALRMTMRWAACLSLRDTGQWSVGVQRFGQNLGP